MSALIRQLVVRKRAAETEAKANAERYAQLLAEAKGEDGRTPAHEWDGTRLRFENPDGSWGEWVDLRGKKGAKGDKGEKGDRVVVLSGGGRAGASLDTLPPSSDSDEPTAVAVLQNGQWVSLSWAAFSGMVSGAGDMGVAMSRRTDFVGSSLMYRGEAQPGSSESAPVWRIKRVQFAPDGDVTEMWAGGTADFAHAWDQRGSLSYA